MSADSPRVAVGVAPGHELQRRRRLFAALEAAFPVRFEAREGGEKRWLDAFLALGRDEPPGGLPALRLLAEEPEETGAATLRLAGDGALPPSLRGAELSDAHLAGSRSAPAHPEVPAGGTALATWEGRPAWVAAGKLRTGAMVPCELGPGEALRERLRDGRCAALLPLVHFLRELTEPIAWRPPPPRASFLFDDPNLHWPSYGYMRLAELVPHARRHGYHAALATVPFDAWLADPRALRAVREAPAAISLLVHGNNHDGGELGRPDGEAEAIAIGAQALRRIATLERRTGLRVDRVMVPPHEVCSAAVPPALRRCGFDALSMTLPYPWLASPPEDWLARPADADALVGWRPAGFTRGLPVLLRHPLAGRSLAEMRLRAFLGQPLILYGHHDDLAEGVDLLAEAAAEVDRLGATRWCSLGEIAAGSFETRRLRGGLALRLLSNRVRIRIPADARELTVELPPSGDAETSRLLVNGAPAPLGEPVPVAPGATVQVSLRAPDPVDVHSVPPPRGRTRAAVRRVASEGRDRLLPLVGRGR